MTPPPVTLLSKKPSCSPGLSWISTNKCSHQPSSTCVATLHKQIEKRIFSRYASPLSFEECCFHKVNWAVWA